MSLEIPIIVEKVIFRSPKGFAILACSLNPNSDKFDFKLKRLVEGQVKKNSYNNFTVTINRLGDDEEPEGRQYIFHGDFAKHEKYGDQFKADSYYQDIPHTEIGFRNFLMKLPNVKKSISKDIIQTFGVEETIRILDEEPRKLLQINYITERRLPAIIAEWKKTSAKRNLEIRLMDYGISSVFSEKIYNAWKERCLDILLQNPYRLTELDGIGFVIADTIAHKVLKNVPKDYRTKACIEFVLTEYLNKNGNLCMPLNEMGEKVLEQLAKGSEANSPGEPFVASEYKLLIPKCVKENLDTFAAVKPENGRTYVYLKKIWDKEKYIANQIYQRRIEEQRITDSDGTDPEDVCDEKDIEKAEYDIANFSGRTIKLDNCQKEAILSAFKHKITIITGGGGTGKSTICRCIFYLAKTKNLSVRMMSPTGKAAQVLSSKTDYPAGTIHRSLEMMPGDDFPKGVITEDIIIVDEVSMVGIDTMFAIMYAMEQNIYGHLILVGDCNQLPSVSPGNFLFDIMNSRCANVVKLDIIHRQSEDSYIPLLANDISNGKVVKIPENAIDIKWHSLATISNFDFELRKIIRERINNNCLNDFQILAPMYRGEYGVNKINEIVQDEIATVREVKDRPFNRIFSTYYIGDRVIQTQNNYDKNVFNGDMGIVLDAGHKIIKPDETDKKQSYVVVKFYGHELMFIDDEIDQLKIAWCITIHKFQGSQAKNIMFVLPNEAYNMSTKELVYTGMTRSETHLDIYGHWDTFQAASIRSAIKKRYSNINNIISELKDNKKILKILE